MSFSVELIQTKSEKNKIGKALTTIVSTTADLKEGTSITDPVLLLSINQLQSLSINYVKITQMKRCYFINDMIAVRNGLWELHCHVDVLESWKNEILSNAAVIQRQERLWNLYLNDGQFKVYQNPNITLFPFPSGFSAQTPCFALAVAGSPGATP